MSKSLLLLVLLTPGVLRSQGPSQPEPTRSDVAQWAIDPTHSELTFEIRHFISRVQGTFKDWRGTIVADPGDWAEGEVSVVIRTASLSTNNDKRDTDLRSPNFFAADSFPEITFRSTKIERSGDRGRIYGSLTMHGVTRPVVLDANFLGRMKAGGRDHLGFEATATVNRTEWGITWNRVVEGGGVTLGDDVKIAIVIDAVRQMPAPAK